MTGEDCEALQEALERFNDSMVGSYYAELVACDGGKAIIALYEEECPNCSLDEAMIELVKALEEEGVKAELEGEEEAAGGERLLTLKLSGARGVTGRERALQGDSRGVEGG